jgi:nucleotide-binding universal stress UspA family protein
MRPEGALATGARPVPFLAGGLKMAYRTILVELTSARATEADLSMAARLAERFAATLIGLHVVVPPFVPSLWQGGGAVYIDPQLIEAQRQAVEALRARVEDLFRARCAELAGASCRVIEGDPATLLARAGRTADLVVTAGGWPDDTDTAAIAEHLVVATGVPVLVVPPGVEGGPGQSVVAGWNGSREATRAVHQALPFLITAQQVALCAVGEEHATSLEGAAAMLRRHDVPVTAVQVPGLDRHAGELLLAEAAARRADLLVVGAYGHARLRELIFGGVTRHLLREAPIPVLFGS